MSRPSRPTPSSTLVYSTDTGRICPGCGQSQTRCACAANARAVTVGDGAVRVRRETQKRGGKTVTTVRGLPLPPDALVALGKRLRTACGTGGTAKDGVLELQGDHVERVLALLVAEGFAAKRGGG